MGSKKMVVMHLLVLHGSHGEADTERRTVVEGEWGETDGKERH